LRPHETDGVHRPRLYSDYYVLLIKNDPKGVEQMVMIIAIPPTKRVFCVPHHFRFLSEHVFSAYHEKPNH
jgi:chemotaxis methyl-accepting protein methylase